MPRVDVKMNLKIITKNHAADPAKGFLKKSILKPYGLTRLGRKLGC